MTIRLFEVGGSIRDNLLGIDNPPDRDFCAESPEGWEALLAWCHANMERVFLVTPEFFTVRGRMSNGDAIDVVMCRKDGPSSDGRHPDTVEPGTLLDDLARRDFTVNAMAREVDPGTLAPMGGLIDPFEGKRDLLNRRLKCVGETPQRLEEDGLRILRAARFAVTKELIPVPALSRCLRNLPFWWHFAGDTVSVERIREEVQKMMKHDTVSALRFFTNNCHPSAIEVVFKDIWLKPTMEKR